MLNLFVHNELEQRLPLWLEPFLADLAPCPVVALPADLGTLGIDRRGLSLAWHDNKRFRLPQFNRGKSAAVAKALGDTTGLTVLDACAGFGEDTLGLSAAMTITLAENSLSSVLFLAERVHNLSVHRPARQAALMVEFIDAFELMERAEPGNWDVVYLDPMFPERGKRALPKIQMQVLSGLKVEVQHAPEKLLASALRVASKRVVLKRRAKDPVLLEPSFQQKGSKVRFDIYLN